MGRRGASTWISIYRPDVVGWYGPSRQCSSDVHLVVRTPGRDDVEKKLRASRGGKGRYDLRCNIPGCPRGVYWMRVLGRAFLNRQHMSWAQHNVKEKVAGNRTRYLWQVNHLDGGPQHCILSRMELCRQEDNADHYASHASALHDTVQRKPACQLKRKSEQCALAESRKGSLYRRRTPR